MTEVGMNISQGTPKVVDHRRLGRGDHHCVVFPGKRYLDWDLDSAVAVPRV